MKKSSGFRVAVVTHYWRGAGGGVATYVSGLVDGLREKGFDVRVFFRDGDDCPGASRISGGKLAFVAKAFLALLFGRFDVVHTHGSWYCLAAGFAARELRACRRLVHTFHSEPEQRLSPPVRRFLQALVDGCDAVTFNSQGLREAIEASWGLRFSCPTFITYGFVRPREVADCERQEFRRRFGIPEDAYPVLLIQAFTANKLKAEGAKMAMEVFRRLKAQHPRAVLVLTREGPYSRELREYAARLGIGDSAVFTGDVDPWVALAASDVLLYPWKGRTGFAFAVLEALLAGKPVVATAHDGRFEMLERGGGIVTKPEADPFYQALELALAHSLDTESVEANYCKTGLLQIAEAYGFARSVLTCSAISESGDQRT